MSERIRMYTDWSYKARPEAPPAFILHPWHIDTFGTSEDIKDKSEFRDVDRFRSLRENYGTFFGYVLDPANADFAVLPSDWKHYQRASTIHQGIQFLELMQQLQKRAVVQYNADDDLPLDLRTDVSPVPSAPVIVRTSFNASKKRTNEYAMPGFVGDPLAVYGGGKLNIRERTSRPTLSFCGWSASVPLSDRDIDHFHDLVDEGLSGVDANTQAELVYAFRAKVLNTLQESGKFQTDFIRRGGYCGGVDRDRNPEGLLKVRQEYFQSMNNSDYVVCIRGKGNYSYRFYETLAWGRIPIFIDTDTPLPFLDKINWRDYCVWVNHRDVEKIGDIVAAHYHAMDSDQYRQLQINVRRIWEEMLTLEKYFYHLLTAVKQ